MKTTLIQPTFQISITEIESDYENETNLEICFKASLSLDYAKTTPFGIDSPSDLIEFYEFDDTIDYEFNVAQRHQNGLYFTISGDSYGGDYHDDIESAIFQFGKPIIDFIDDACKLLKIPFYPNR